ncbi:fatty acid desaturase family protein [Altericroceibacterium indicum]|nr:fatty acid desaturase [Altericroceibacterium indicum]
MYLSDISNNGQSPSPAPSKKKPEDKELLRLAAGLNKELGRARPEIYWPDMLLSASIGYGALYLAMTSPSGWVVAGSWIVATLLLYRASLFIHEISHLKAGALPGFHFVWNLIVGVPLLIPSFMYEGVHTIHHQRTRYGTALDPEYLPLSHMRVRTLVVFMGTAALAPIAFLIRHAVFVPLSVIFPSIRRLLMTRLSSLAINPQFIRPTPTPALRKSWAFWDGAVSLWSIAIIVLTAVGTIPLRAFITYMLMISGAMIVNQIRTLVAHLWDNEGDEMNITDQYLDSVNVPPPGYLPALWAPVGLRYHGLHHLLPGVPYHSLGEAHRRLIAGTQIGSTYHRANYPNLSGLLCRLVSSASRSGK